MKWTKIEPEFEVPIDVYIRELDGQMVLLNLASEEYFGLDPVGADIVNHLVKHPSATALDRLTEKYEVDPAILRQDIEELVTSLLTVGLLKEARPSG